jgi:hypothetical protein
MCYRKVDQVNIVGLGLMPDWLQPVIELIDDTEKGQVQQQ